MRIYSIDWLKAVGIVTVVWIHSIGVPFTPEALSWSTYLASWAVPGFLFASGFLHYREEPVSADLLRQWARRLLVPYLIASVLALLFRATVLGHHNLTPGLAVYSVLTASAFGLYYYVGVLLLALFTLVPVLARWPRLAAPITILFLALGLCSAFLWDPFYWLGGLFWYQRSPMVWWQYLLVGWMAARYWPAVRDLGAGPCRAAGILALAIGIGVAGTCSEPGLCTPVAPLTVMIANYAWIAALVLLLRDTPAPAAVVWLSGATYPIYLYHRFFVESVLHVAPRVTLDWRYGAFVAALAGTVLLVVTARALLGARARLLVG